MTSAQKTLNVISIVIIVLAIISIVFGFILLACGGIFAAGSQSKDLAEALASNSTIAQIGIVNLGIASIAAAIILLISGIIDLLIGIFGKRGAKNPEKIGVFFVLCVIGVIFNAIGLIDAFLQGSGMSSILSNAINLALVIWCLYLANQIKHMKQA